MRILPVLLCLAALPLAACGNDPITRYFDWQKQAEVVEFTPEPLYCYRTLARSDCFAQPLDKRESNRVVSYYGVAPGRVAPPPVVPPLPKDRLGAAVDHPPLMVPVEKVESAPLPVPGRPGAPQRQDSSTD